MVETKGSSVSPCLRGEKAPVPGIVCQGFAAGPIMFTLAGNPGGLAGAGHSYIYIRWPHLQP